jgi:hypothetical protein
LFHLGQDRCVQLNLEQACRELRVLVLDIQDKANAEAAKLARGKQPDRDSEPEEENECKLEKSRRWVKSLGEIIESDPAGGSQASRSLHKAEEDAEREWAGQNSFRKHTRDLPSEFTLSQYLTCATRFQAGLQQKGFSGDWTELGMPHKYADLLVLANRAEAALDAVDDLDSDDSSSESDSSESGGSGGEDGGGGRGSGRKRGRQNSNGSGDPGSSGRGGGGGGGGGSSSSNGRSAEGDSNANADGDSGQHKKSRREGAGGFREHSSAGGAGGQGDSYEGASCGSSRIQEGGGSLLHDGRNSRGRKEMRSRLRRSAAASASGGGLGGMPNQAELSEEGLETRRESASEGVWYADEDPEAIPAEARQEELGRRMATRQALADFKRAQAAYALEQAAGGAREAAAVEPVEPRVEQPRIWKDGTWHKRLAVPRREIKGWGTAYLKGGAAQEAASRLPSTTILNPADRGDKYVEQGSVQLRRSRGESLCIFSGDRPLPKGSIVGPYVGDFFDADTQSRHKTGSKVGTHRLTLRTSRACMPLTVAGIDGPVRHTLVNGRRYDLNYYLTNGVASLANSRSDADSNCKVLVEYSNYESVGQLYIDDEYCPDHVPMNQRVTPPPPPTPPRPAAPVHACKMQWVALSMQPAAVLT